MQPPGHSTIELPASDAPMVSVVVLLTREADMAERCLRAVATGVDPEVETEVVLVLNAPDEETLALVEHRTRDARTIRSRVNTGTGVGWNLAFAAARGRWVALIHEDSEPEPGWLGPLLETAERLPQAAVIGSRLLWSDPERAGQVWNRGNIMWSDGTPGHLTDEALDEEGPYVCDHCSSAGAMFDRAAWEAVGGFDERYFPAVRHEMDLCVALWRMGRTVVCDPRSTVQHRGAAMVRADHGATSGPEFRSFLVERSRLLLIDKWGAALDAYETRRPGLRTVTPTAAELRAARERTEARAAAGPRVLDSSPRSVRALSSCGGGWPDAVDAPMERRLLQAQVAVQGAFSDELHESLIRHEARARELEDRIAVLEAESGTLAERARTLDLVLEGRWWRLRRRLDPAVRLARRISRRPA